MIYFYWIGQREKERELENRIKRLEKQLEEKPKSNEE
jgi:BMFP domain-containing protein YqiC